jgi:RNA polymerase sigma-70 factor (ECF subfamily)
MLGSVSEADDAVQESWLRLRRTDPGAIEDLRAWLTAVVGRICLDTKARQARREDQAGPWLPEPLVAEPGTDGPESQAIIAESIGLALLIVLESLTPPERLAFVLHDVFAVPFGTIGQIMGRTTETARQLASRARRRVQAGTPTRSTARSWLSGIWPLLQTSGPPGKPFAARDAHGPPCGNAHPHRAAQRLAGLPGDQAGRAQRRA